MGLSNTRVRELPISEYQKSIVNICCVVIGSTNLCISCIDDIIKHDGKLLGVVALDKAVNDYCIDNDIKIIDISDINEITDKFYLFSIINHRILDDTILNNSCLIKAINYHDSLLPRYAGINSTTWAILNSELFHGITWHQIDNGIDTGSIFYQRKILIENNETSFSLNIKCTEQAKEAFALLLVDIKNNGNYPASIYAKKQYLS